MLKDNLTSSQPPSALAQTAFALAPHLKAIAREAGRRIMEVYQRPQPATNSLKADNSPLTEADLAAHAYLVQALSPLLPNCAAVSEEEEASHALRRPDTCFWLLDPLDGTKEFLARNGQFTVNIALVEHSHSCFGVVYAPALDKLYWGGRGLGAFCEYNAEETPIQVTAPAKNAPVRVMASKSHMNCETQQFIAQLGPVDLVQAGSSLKICHIAEGVADIYPRLAPTCEWDTAAAHAVLEGAGGYMMDATTKQPLRYGKAESTLNPSFIATRTMKLLPHA